MATDVPPPTFVRVLAEIEEIRDSLRRLEFEVVRMMREVGVTWEAIGDELGISRQAASSRFAKPRARRDE